MKVSVSAALIIAVVFDGFDLWLWKHHSVAGDLPEYMHGHAGVSHPRQAGVPQAVTHELLGAMLGKDPIPASWIPRRGRGDPPTPRACENAGVWVTIGQVDSLLNQGHRCQMRTALTNRSCHRFHGAKMGPNFRTRCSKPPNSRA